MHADKTGYAFNQTRQTFLATQLRVADTHWRRLVGLLGTSKRQFQSGAGLWIAPCHGVHTLAMRYPIDVVYLDRDHRVLLVEHSVRPWRMTPVLVEAATVIELPAHTAWSTGTKEGDQVEIKVGQAAEQSKEAKHDAGSLRAS
jgi:uncharacterized membrane protein (UPF0127 family)